MKKEEFKELMDKLYDSLKVWFSKEYVLPVRDKSSDDPKSKLFLIKSNTVNDSVMMDTALIVKVKLSTVRRDKNVFKVSSYYAYPYMSTDLEEHLITKTGELLESLVPEGYVICESGDVKVKAATVTELSKLFNTNKPRRVV